MSLQLPKTPWPGSSRYFNTHGRHLHLPGPPGAANAAAAASPRPGAAIEVVRCLRLKMGFSGLGRSRAMKFHWNEWCFSWCTSLAYRVFFGGTLWMMDDDQHDVLGSADFLIDPASPTTSPGPRQCSPLWCPASLQPSTNTIWVKPSRSRLPCGQLKVFESDFPLVCLWGWRRPFYLSRNL